MTQDNIKPFLVALESELGKKGCTAAINRSEKKWWNLDELILEQEVASGGREIFIRIFHQDPLFQCEYIPVKVDARKAVEEPNEMAFSALEVTCRADLEEQNL